MLTTSRSRSPAAAPTPIPIHPAVRRTRPPLVSVGDGGASTSSVRDSAVSSSPTTDTSRVSDGFAALVFPLIAGQQLGWRDLLYHGGVDSLGTPWSLVTWTGIVWDTVSWEDILWESFRWQDILWDTVAGQDVLWDTVFDPLSGSGPGWAPLN